MKTAIFLQWFIVFLGITMVTPAIVCADESGGNINTVLTIIEGHAEDMVDAALARDRRATLKLHKEIQGELGQLHRLAAQQPFDERRSRELVMAYSWLRVIAIDVKQGTWVGVAIAANQLDGSIIRFAQFPTLRKRDIAWLDYLGRELLLLTMENPKANAELLAIRRSELADTWHRVKRDLIKNFRNKTLLMQGDDIVTKIEHGYNTARSINLARQWLDYVDHLEKVK